MLVKIKRTESRKITSLYNTPNCLVSTYKIPNVTKTRSFVIAAENGLNSFTYPSNVNPALNWRLFSFVELY